MRGLPLTSQAGQAKEVVLHQAHVSHHHVQHVLAHRLHIAAELQTLAVQQHHPHLPLALLHLPALILGDRRREQMQRVGNSRLEFKSNFKA